MLLIDDRAGSNELIPILGTGDDLSICRLDSGDVCIPGNGPSGDILIGVEVKKVPDLLSSIATGRLGATQLPRLMVDYDEVWLLIVGDYKPGPRGELQVASGSRWRTYSLGSRQAPYSYLEGFIIELAAMGVFHKRVGSNTEAAWWLRSMEHFYSKPWAKHKAMKKFDKSGRPTMVGNPNDPDYRRKLQVAEVAQALPGMGWERAWALAEVFPTPYELIVATPEQYAGVDGIGKTLAKQLWEAIHGR